MLRKFQSHKTVEAAKIVDINPLIGAGHNLIFEGGGIIEVGDEWIERHAPEKMAQNLIGGWYVRYPDSDSYVSWSPAEPFEAGYTEIPEVQSTSLDHVTVSKMMLDNIRVFVEENIEDSRARALVMTKIDEADMWLDNTSNK